MRPICAPFGTGVVGLAPKVHLGSGLALGVPAPVHLGPWWGLGVLLAHCSQGCNGGYVKVGMIVVMGAQVGPLRA